MYFFVFRISFDYRNENDPINIRILTMLTLLTHKTVTFFHPLELGIHYTLIPFNRICFFLHCAVSVSFSFQYQLLFSLEIELCALRYFLYSYIIFLSVGFSFDDELNHTKHTLNWQFHVREICLFTTIEWSDFCVFSKHCLMRRLLFFFQGFFY